MFSARPELLLPGTTSAAFGKMATVTRLSGTGLETFTSAIGTEKSPRMVCIGRVAGLKPDMEALLRWFKFP